MKTNKMMLKVIAAVLLVVAGLLCFTVLAKHMTDAQTYAHTIQAIDEKKATVMTLTATAAAASTGLAAIPGDVTTPIANQIMEISEYLFVVVCFLVLEKSLLTVMGFLGCKILLPVACVLSAICLFWNKPNLKVLAMKLAVFAALITGIIPLSVRISDMIYDVNKLNVEELTAAYQETVSVEETMPVEHTVPMTEPADEETGWLGNLVSGFADQVEKVTDKVGEVAENVTDKVGQTVSQTVDDAKALLNRFVDAIALFVITYCAIPVIVVLVMVWFVKFLFQVQIPVPRSVEKTIARWNRTEVEEKALSEV